MKRTLSLLVTACLFLSGCSATPPQTLMVTAPRPPPPVASAPPPMTPAPILDLAKRELNRAKIVTVAEPDILAEALIHELAGLSARQRTIAGGKLLVPEKVKVTFMSAAERAATGEVKIGLEVFGLGPEVRTNPSASLEELQELSISFAVETKNAGKVARTPPGITIGIAQAFDGLREELQTFAAAGKGYLIPGCAKIAKHFELDTDLKTSGELGMKLVSVSSEVELGGHVGDTVEILFKVAGYKGECDF